MKLSQIRDWLEVVGLFAVVLSLLFVGWEVKQARDIAVAGEYQARTETAIEYNKVMLEDSELRSLLGGDRGRYLEIARSFPGGVDLAEQVRNASAEQFGAYVALSGMWIAMQENLFFQHQIGFLPEEKWLGIVEVQRSNVGNDYIWMLVESRRGELPASFQDHLDALRREHLESASTE